MPLPVVAAAPTLPNFGAPVRLLPPWSSFSCRLAEAAAGGGGGGGGSSSSFRSLRVSPSLPNCIRRSQKQKPLPLNLQHFAWVTHSRS